MTEPDNPLHELVRQQLAGYQPPYDPDNWQRMRRRLRRDRWWPVGWWLLGVCGLLGIGWFTLRTEPNAVVTPARVAVSIKPDSVRSPTTHKERVDKAAGLLPVKLFAGRNSVLNRVPAVPDRLPTGSSPEPLPIRALRIPAGPALPPVLVHSPVEPDIIRRVTTGVINGDATPFRVLSRNMTQWPNAVVVCDFTSSMDRYSTQVMAWLRKNQTSNQVRGLVFFTDCDSLGHETAPGQTGQLFTTRSRTVADVLPLMLASARNTLGNVNDTENVVAPLVRAQQQFPGAEHLILIADNSSAVKDISRLGELHQPVHIILCGPTLDTAVAIQPDYITIARQTGGSLHTLEDDLPNVAQLRPNTWIRIDGRYYRRTRRGRFVVTDFRHRPRRVLGLFWR